MAALTIRNLDDNIKQQLRVQAAQHGWSMEEEARRILRQHLMRQPPDEGLGTRLHRRFSGMGGVALDLPPRTQARNVDFHEDAS